MNQKITGTRSGSAGFSVYFPNGIDGEPEINIEGLSIDLNGDSLIYGAICACANFLNDHVEDLKSRKQHEFNVSDFTDKNGVLNFSFKEGLSDK